MDGIDYTKALNKQTQNYYDSLDKSRAAAKKEIKSTEELADSKLNKLKESSREKQLNTEKVFNDRVETITDDAKRVVQEKQKAFAEKNKKESEFFVKNKEEQLTDYQKRLESLSDSYRSRDKDSSEFHDRHLKNNKNRFAEKVDNLQRNHEAEIDDVVDRTRDSSSKLREDMSREKQRMTKAGVDKTQLMEHNQALENSRIKNETRRNINQIAETSNDLVTHSEKRSKENFDRLQAAKITDHNELQNLFSDQADKQRLAHAVEKEKLVQKQKDQVYDMEKGFNKEKTTYEQELKRDIGEDTTGRFAKEQEINRNRNILSNKDKQYNELLTASQRKYNDEIDKLKLRNELSSRETAIENAKNIDAKEKSAGMTTMENLANFNRQKEVIVDNFQNREKINTGATTKIFESEKDTSRKRLDNLKNTYVDTLDNLTEKNRVALEEMRRNEGLRRTALIQQNRADTNLAVTELKKINAEKLTVSQLEADKRLAENKQKTKDMQTFYEDKLDATRKEFSNMLNKQNYVFTEQRKQDLADAKTQAAIREEELRSAIDAGYVKYNKDMSDMAQAYERKIKTMSIDYENRISTMHTDRDKENNRLQSEYNEQLERVKLANKNEKDRLITQYENRISKLSDAFNLKKNSLDDYKAEVASTQRAADAEKSSYTKAVKS